MQSPVVYITALIVTSIMFCKGFCSFMLCAYEVIEYFHLVAKLYYKRLVLFKKKINKKIKKLKIKKKTMANNMVLETIDSSE